MKSKQSFWERGLIHPHVIHTSYVYPVPLWKKWDIVRVLVVFEKWDLMWAVCRDEFTSAAIGIDQKALVSGNGAK